MALAVAQPNDANASMAVSDATSTAGSDGQVIPAAAISIENDTHDDTCSINSSSSGRVPSPSTMAVADHTSSGGMDDTVESLNENTNVEHDGSNNNNNNSDNVNGMGSSLAKGVAAHNSKLLPPEYKLGDDDVICGRGSRCFNHTGNKKFRKIVEEHLDRYSNTLCKFDKTNIICEIVTIVRQYSPNGGFVKKDTSTGRYYEVGDFLAREKTSQAFRDALQDQYKSSNATKKKRRLLESQNLLRKTVSAPFLSVQRSNAMMTSNTGNPAMSFLHNNNNVNGSLHRQVTDNSIVSSASNNMMSNPTASGHNLVNGSFPHNSGVDLLGTQRNATFSNFQSQMQAPDNVGSSRNATFGQQQPTSSMQLNTGTANFGGGNSNMFLQRMGMNQSSTIGNNAANNKMYMGVQNSNNPGQALSMNNNQNSNMSTFNHSMQQNQVPRFASVLGNSVLQEFSNSMKNNNINANMQHQMQSPENFGLLNGNRFNNADFFSSNNAMPTNNTSEGLEGNQLGYQQQNKTINLIGNDMANNHNMMINNAMDREIGNHTFEMIPPPTTTSDGTVYYSSIQASQNSGGSHSKYNAQQQHVNFAEMGVNEVDMEDKLDKLDELLTESIQNEDCEDNDGNSNYINLLSDFFDMDSRGVNNTGSRGGSFPQSCPDLRGNMQKTKREHASISQMRNETFDLDSRHPTRQSRQLSCLLEEPDDSTSSVTGATTIQSASKPLNWEENELQNNTWGEGGGTQQFQNQLSSDANFEPISFFEPENGSDIWNGESLMDSFAVGRDMTGRSGKGTLNSLAVAQSCPDLGNQPQGYRPSMQGAARMGRQMLLETTYESNETWGTSQNNSHDISQIPFSSNALLTRLSASGRNSLTNGNQQRQAVPSLPDRQVPSSMSSNGFSKPASACGKPNLLLATLGKQRVGSVSQQQVTPIMAYGLGQANNISAASFQNRQRENNDARPMLGNNNSQNLFQKQQESHGGGSNNLDQLPFLSEDVLMRLPTWSESELMMDPDDDKLQQIADDLFTS